MHQLLFEQNDLTINDIDGIYEKLENAPVYPTKDWMFKTGFSIPTLCKYGIRLLIQKLKRAKLSAI